MYADALQPFQEVTKETPAPNAYSQLKELDQEKTCHIAQAADLCMMLAKGVNKSKGVYKLEHSLRSASWSDVSPAYCLVF